jgi:hypothetical protein
MSFGGGETMSSGVNLYYIWYGNWSGNAAISILEDLGRSIGGTSYLDILTSYHDAAGNPIRNAVTLSDEVYIDSSSASWRGTSLTGYDPGNIVSDVLASHRFPSDGNGLYVVLTAPEVRVQDFGTHDCGFHGHLAGTPAIKYAFVGNGSQINSCIFGFGNQNAPNGDAAADYMASVLSHELAEAMASATGFGWLDVTGAELGDKCLLAFGTVSTNSSGKLTNMHLGTRDYLIQGLWINGPHGMCSTALSAASLACTNAVKDGDETDVGCGGSCPQCLVGQHCSVFDDCLTGQGSCLNGTCAHDCSANNDQIKDGSETDVDCGDGCGLCGVGKTCQFGTDCGTGICAGNTCRCVINDDCPMGTLCKLGICMPTPTCTDGVKNGTETDTDCGGSTCGPCGPGKQCSGAGDCTTEICVGNVCRCATNADCSTGQRCMLGYCMTATCFDGSKNGSESDTDCGGGTCAACGPGKACNTGADCTTETCVGNTCRCTSNADCAGGQKCSLGYCVSAATCSDGITNGVETDVDCGGGTCGACAPGKHCSTPADCTTDVCVANVCRCTSNADCGANQHCSLGYCLSLCTDGTTDGNETDVDCGGGTCAACMPGKHCSTGYDCTTEICAGNTCRCTSPADCPPGNTRCLLGVCYP